MAAKIGTLPDVKIDQSLLVSGVDGKSVPPLTDNTNTSSLSNQPVAPLGSASFTGLYAVSNDQQTDNHSASNPPNSSTKADDCVNTALPYKVARKAGRILQHFAIRTPHIFVAMSSVYLITKYYFGQQEFAVEATTFVGTASAMYCFLRPFFLEVIPYSVLKTDQKLWREAINFSNTIFVTLTLSSAVWGLKIQAIVGTAIWAASFGVPFAPLSSGYPPIDAHFKSNP